MNGKEYQMIKTLYTAANAPEAHLIKGLLEQSGIEVSLAGESLTIGIGGLPIDAAQVEVKVNEDQFEEAVKIIKEYEDKMLGDDEENSLLIHHQHRAVGTLCSVDGFTAKYKF